MTNSSPTVSRATTVAHLEADTRTALAWALDTQLECAAALLTFTAAVARRGRGSPGHEESQTLQSLSRSLMGASDRLDVLEGAAAILKDRVAVTQKIRELDL